MKHILWNEIVQLKRTSAYPLPFVVRDLCIEKRLRRVNKQTEVRDYPLGHVTQTVESFQGHHLESDKPRVLAIFDEASSIPSEYYEAAQSWAHRILVIGNPLSTDNFFYSRCKQGNVADPAGLAGLLRNVIHIDGLDMPNVQLGRR